MMAVLAPSLEEKHIIKPWLRILPMNCRRPSGLF